MPSQKRVISKNVRVVPTDARFEIAVTFASDDYQHRSLQLYSKNHSQLTMNKNIDAK